MPLKAVTSQSLAAADPVTGASVPAESERHDDQEGDGTGGLSGSRVPAGGVSA